MNKDDKKNNNKQKEEERLKELEKLIKQLESEGNPKKIKIITIKETSTKDKVKNIFIDIILNIVLFLGISGWYKWANGRFVDILVLSIIYTCFETLLKYVIRTFIPKALIYSFGTIDAIVCIISYIFSMLLIPSVYAVSTFAIVLFFVIFIVLKLLIKLLFFKNMIDKQIFRRK